MHWGLVIGIVACIGLGLWLRVTASGFSVRVVGGNPRTAQLVGLPATRLILAACGVGGACAGVAGAVVVPAGKVLKQTDLELEKMNYLVEGVIGSA